MYEADALSSCGKEGVTLARVAVILEYPNPEIEEEAPSAVRHDDAPPQEWPV